MLVRSPTNNFEVVDLTSAVRNIPIQYGTFNQMGIFATEGVAGDTVMFEETTADGALLLDQVRGTKNTVGKDGTRKLKTFAIPHFPHDEYITPKDLKSQSAYDNFNEVETLDNVRMEKMRRARQNHDWTLNKARAQALFLSTAYAPNGTVSENWDTIFGITRDAVDFTLGTSSAEMLEKCEAVIDYVQQGMGGNGVFTGIVLPCHPTFFSNFIKHASVKAAYTYQRELAGRDPIRSRLSEGGTPMQMGREFYFGGITFREIKDSYNGTNLATTAEGVAVPMGSGYFKTFFGSPERFGLVNTKGEMMYAFETAKQNGTGIEIETESNHISASLRPKAVVRAYTSN